MMISAVILCFGSSGRGEFEGNSSADSLLWICPLSTWVNATLNQRVPGRSLLYHLLAFSHS